ncbi:hypothetical protein FSP39_020795 [Pinctada imbricata]|uniref:RRM domain-containing protein n=1 Tax=Pinctada imbricata TaxID=66713 RepID=A0AA88YV47_PINIB|nr:hypothetical protein FSP39_020795 [Pinctada imbricata]
MHFDATEFQQCLTSNNFMSIACLSYLTLLEPQPNAYIEFSCDHCFGGGYQGGYGDEGPYNKFNRYGGGGGGGGGGGDRNQSRTDLSNLEDPVYRKLFIGGLSYETSLDTMKGFFEQFGEIEDVVVMKDPQSKRSRGFGFVTYKKSQSVHDVQTSRPHKIDEREVETKRAMPRDNTDPNCHIRTEKMFLGGLKDSTTEDDVRDVFQEFGQIKKIEIIRDQEKKCRGFGFLTFEDYDPVDYCVIRKNFTVSGKRIEVKKATDKNQQQQDQRQMGGMGGGPGIMGRGQGGYGRGNYGGGNYEQGGYGGGYNQGGNYGGGYGGAGGGWGNQGGGYDGGYGGGYGGGPGGGGGGWGPQFGQGYNDGYSGGAMKQGYSQRGQSPYGRGKCYPCTILYTALHFTNGYCCFKPSLVIE